MHITSIRVSICVVCDLDGEVSPQLQKRSSSNCYVCRTFIIGFIPLAGDVIDALLGYNLVIKQAKKADIVSNRRITVVK